MKYKKYDTSLNFAERKLKKLEKDFAAEQKELSKLQRAWTSGKERVRIAKNKAKSSKSPSIQSRVKLTVEKQDKLSKQYQKQKTKVVDSKVSLRSLKAEIRNIKTEKRQYKKAMEKYEKQWLQFYAREASTSSRRVSSIDKVDFGIQLRAARALLNLSESEFSTLINVPSSLLKQIEQPNNTISLEPQLIKSIKSYLSKANIELIDVGLYVNTGGVGVRIKNNSMSIRGSKPKTKQKKTTISKSDGTKKKRRLRKVS